MNTGDEQRNPDPFADLPLLIPVPRAAQLLGISRAAAYRFAKRGQLGGCRHCAVRARHPRLAREVGSLRRVALFLRHSRRDSGGGIS
jgi:predicted site-specific integrase-resolvase